MPPQKRPTSVSAERQARLLDVSGDSDEREHGLNDRRCQSAAVAVVASLLVVFAAATAAAAPAIPVVFDTDIGTDIDDTWALALILRSPELDLKLVLSDTGDTRLRARIAAKLLQAAGRDDVPVAIGVAGSSVLPIGQAPWVEGYDLEDYPGPVYEDGVEALIDVVRSSPEPITILAVGPVPNLEEALRRAPDLAGRVRVVAMSGSVDRGYVGKPTPDAEYNVSADSDAARAMYEAEWDLLIAPLDTAGQVQLKGDVYQRLIEADDALVKAILENYRIWAPTFRWADHDPDRESSVLYDALAVALAYDDSFCRIEEVRLEVTDDGFTRRSSRGSPVRVALEWKRERREFEEFLVDRLLGR